MRPLVSRTRWDKYIKISSHGWKLFSTAPLYALHQKNPCKILSLTTTTITALSEEIPHHNKLLCVFCNSFTNNLEPCVCPLNISGEDLTFSSCLPLLPDSPPSQLSLAVFWVVMFNLRIRQKPAVCLEQLIGFQETFTGRERLQF